MTNHSSTIDIPFPEKNTSKHLGHIHSNVVFLLFISPAPSRRRYDDHGSTVSRLKANEVLPKL